MKICYLVSHGFSARMVLHSKLPECLKGQECELLAFFPEAGGPEFDAMASRVRFVAADFRISKWTHLQLSELRRYFREPIQENAALWSRHLFNVHSLKSIIRWRALAMHAIHRIAHPSKIMRGAFEWLDQTVHQSAIIRRQLEQMAPDLVVSTYPVSSFESTVLLEAQRLGIPTVGHLLSWDNISCKGRFVVVPDHFVSWGPIMTEELERYYNVERSRIFECGVTHFDAHVQAVDIVKRSVLLREMGLDPEQPYLFFGMSSPVFAPREIDIVEWLASKINAGVFGPTMQLVIRPHPQNVTGYMADTSWLPRLKCLKSPRVGLSMPLLEQSQLAWNMQQADLDVLVNTLSGCAVSLNSGSTLSIDSLIQGKPVVVTLFDAHAQLPWWQSARRIREFPHYKRLLETGGVFEAGSLEEMKQGICQYIENPNLHLDARRTATYLECGKVDGQATNRVANAIAIISRQKN